MKKLFFFILPVIWLIFSFHDSMAQPYGNEWINYNQSYFKIKTARNGVYRITYDDLVNAGVPVSSIDPRKIQLFHRGVEQAITVSGELNAQLDPADYIEFYGTKNDGTLDENLYRSPDAHPNRYYNLFSDTTAYFLTWTIGTNGKRITSFKENNVNGIPAEPYILSEKLKLFTTNYAHGLQYPVGNTGAETYSANYDYGEGWTGDLIGKGNSTDILLDSLGTLISAGPVPQLYILLNGRNNLAHKVAVSVGPSTSNLRLLDSVTFKYDSCYLFGKALQFSDFSASGSLTIRVTDAGADPNKLDYISVAYVRLRYPRSPDLNNVVYSRFSLAANPGNKSYLEVNNAGNPGYLWNITDPSSIVNIGFNKSDPDINAIINNTLNGADLMLWSGAYLTPVIERASFRNFSVVKPQFVIISNRILMQPSGKYSDPVKAYAAYRASVQGGGYDTLVAEIGDLYNQFSYGETSPLAIKNFCSYLLSKGTPEYLFLVGKSVMNYYNVHRLPAGTYPYADLVPTYGYPGSDIQFTAGKGVTTYEPAIPTGRLSAKTPSEVESYLDKVKESETFTYDQLWKKDLIHLSGGTTPAELSIFKSYVNDLKAVAEDKYLGGQVVTVNKQSNNSVEPINISNEVNKGKLMITFFGHSASLVTDIDIGNVSDPAQGYNNKGKYPFIFVNGCDAGEIFAPDQLSFSEDWMVTADKGSIGFLALSGVGYTVQLKRYADNFYSNAFTDTLYMNKPVGDILKKTDLDYLQFYTPGPVEVAQVQQDVLQGDPAVRLFGAGLPDYAVSDNDVSLGSLNGLPVSSATDSFDISVIVKNFGRVGDSLFYAAVIRTLPDGSKINYDPVSFSPVYYSDTLHFIIDNLNVNAYGLNQFDITIDPLNKIREISKANNTAHFQYFLSKSGTQNLVPYPYSVVPDDSAHLIAQSANPLSANRNFIFQADTVPWFNSPVFTQSNLSAKVVADWPVILSEKFKPADTTVFYWRTRYQDAQPGENNDWSESSFCYIPGSPDGWIQAHPWQLKQDQVTGMEYDSLTGHWNFQENTTKLQVTTYGYLNPDYDFNNVTLSINGQPYIFNTRLCTGNSINALAFDYSSTQAYLVLRFGQYDILDRRSCGKQPQVINNFLNNEITGSSDYLTQYIDNVKAGDYVLLFSIDSVAYQTWSSALKTKVSEIGVSAASLDSLKNGEPVIIIGRKGEAPGTAKIVKANPSSATPTVEQAISLDYDVTGSYTSGQIVSGLIGPARSWGNLSFHTETPNTPDESYSFDVYTVDNQGNESIVSQGILINSSLNSINAKQFPFIRLRFNTENTASLTPAQLKNWMVTFDPMPEGILLPAEGLQLSGTKKQEGETFESGFVFKNITRQDFSDSIRVDLTINNKDLNKTVKESINIGPLNGKSERAFPVTINTLGLGGTNDLTVYANPRIIPERFYNNNIINLPGHFVVNVDRTHPLIDVTVDGRYILDGDIVSPSPLIVIKIKDENKILPKTTPEGISLKMKYDCDTCSFKLVPVDGPEVQWTPASKDQDFTINYNPKNLKDGFYTMQVQATDASGNEAGTQPYSVRFEVVNESTISNFYPYPNPFSSSTRFVFTLTGSEIPDQIKIQIMTISGRVVREITRDEIGPIHIGNNITDYAWNGRDEYGDQLANGVYLYRVLIRMNGQSIPLRQTAGDKAFKQGFGKIYLLR